MGTTNDKPVPTPAPAAPNENHHEVGAYGGMRDVNGEKDSKKQLEEGATPKE